MPLSFVELEEAFRGLFDGRLRNLRLAVPASELPFSEARQDVGLREVRRPPALWGLPPVLNYRLQGTPPSPPEQ